MPKDWYFKCARKSKQSQLFSLGDDEWDLANNDNIDSPFKYGSAAPTVTIR